MAINFFKNYDDVVDYIFKEIGQLKSNIESMKDDDKLKSRISTCLEGLINYDLDYEAFYQDHSFVSRTIHSKFLNLIKREIRNVFDETVAKEIDVYIHSEEFIDKIIQRINKKQIKGK